MCKKITQFSDLGLSSYLLTKGSKLIKTTRDRNKTIFHFEYTSTLDDQITQYFSGEGVISALKFKNALSDLKTLAVNT